MPLEHAQLSFVKTDVAQWYDLKALFKRAKQLHGRIDHVFANAGISNRANYLEDKFDDNGELLEPSHDVFNINLHGAINTAYLGIHYMRTQTPMEGSVVITASASSFQPFRVVDYATSKTGMLGFIRGITRALNLTQLPIRVNGVAPSWTLTGIVPQQLLAEAGIRAQPPEVVAKSVALLMADQSRRAQLIFSVEGKYAEVDEAVLLRANERIPGYQDEEWAIGRIMVNVARQKAVAEVKDGGGDE